LANYFRKQAQELTEIISYASSRINEDPENYET